jgi:hypothetical protein
MLSLISNRELGIALSADSSWQPGVLPSSHSSAVLLRHSPTHTDKKPAVSIVPIRQNSSPELATRHNWPPGFEFIIQNFGPWDCGSIRIRKKYLRIWNSTFLEGESRRFEFITYVVFNFS